MASTSSLTERIKTLCGLSSEAEQFIQKHSKVLEYKKGEVLLQSPSICEYLFYINSGMLRGYYFLDTKEVTNWIAAEEEFGTSFYSFISETGSYETIEAIENTSVEAIRKSDLSKLYEQFPETEKAGRKLLEDYYLRLEERVIFIQFKSAKERYQYFFEKRKEVLKRAPLGCIASYLGITQETLSRIRAEK